MNGKATGETFSQDKFTEEAVKFIDAHKDGPFFLYLPFTIPHLSIQVPDESLAQYKDKIRKHPTSTRRRDISKTQRHTPPTPR